MFDGLLEGVSRRRPVVEGQAEGYHGAQGSGPVLGRIRETRNHIQTLPDITLFQMDLSGYQGSLYVYFTLIRSGLNSI